MKWLLLLSLALVVKGNSSSEQSKGNTVIDPLPDNGIDSANDDSDRVIEPEIAEIIYNEEPMPEPPSDEREESNHERKKRYIKTSTTLWPNNEIIYSYTPSDYSTAGSRSAIEFSIGYLRDRTCLKFTEVDQKNYSAPHVRFVRQNGCQADLGYNPNRDTTCSCCSKGTCYHEMLHVLGFMHEHQRPERDRYIEIDYLVIDPVKWSQFVMLSENEVSYTDKDIYKVGSTMHYSGWAFQKDHFGSAIKTVNDDYQMAEDFYYPIREANIRYKCQQAECSNFNLTCVNDGYVTKYMGKCQCVCPDGLSPKDGCSKAVTSANAVDWPRGSYAFVAAGTGCPAGFNIGHRKHWSAGFSWAQSANNPMKGKQDHYSTEYEFCVSRNNFNNSNNKWPAGVYCLHRVGGTCPEGFTPGAVQFDDFIRSSSSHFNNTKSGDLPDGVFDQDTKFEFCCRSDGLKTIPIELPLTNEFVLYNADNTINDPCQAVKNFNSYKYYYSFNNYISANGSIASRTGKYPFSFTYNGVKTFLFYICHYTPLDVSCGGTIELDNNNPSQKFTSLNFPNNYNHNSKCSWLITAPVGSKIYLDFDKFDVDCSDNVEVRVFNIGEQHPKFCLHNGKTFRSYTNKMTVIFHTSESKASSGFHGNVRFVKDEDNCYDYKDYGASYRGTVNITKNFETCLPWSETLLCRYSSRNPKDAEAGLDSNYCRNPGSADRPWCYTEATECKRRVCDVCQQEKVHDVYADCQKLISTVANFCSQDPRASANCRSSCLKDNPLPSKPQSRSSVSCNPPTTVPSDGYTNDTVKSSYNVGDIITYTCNDNPASTVKLMCSVDGTFNSFTKACKMCDDGWLALNGICYKKADRYMSYTNARVNCEKLGAKLIMPKSQVAYDFLLRVRNKLKETWLGANDIAKEGTWRWLDNTIIRQEDMRFGTGQPSNSSGSYDCASVLSIRNNPLWVDKNCYHSGLHYDSVCEKPGKDVCHDMIPDCSERAAQDYDFCNAENGFAELYCKNFCTGCKKCDAGGDFYNGNCYYPQPDKKLGSAATAACAAMGGHLPIVKSWADVTKINSYFGIQWLGLTDVATEGSFMWPDGTPLGNFNNWGVNNDGTKEPDNYYNSDCVLLYYSKWYDRYCSYYEYYNYVCVKESKVAKCALPNASNNSTLSHGVEPLYQGSRIVTKCNDGYMATSGDITRICLADGTFSGSAPVCEDETTANVITPNNNVPIEDRRQTIATLNGYMFSGDFEQFEIPRAGQIVSWEYFSRAAGNVGLMVFEYNGTNSLKLKGYNYIKTDGASRHSIYHVPIAGRINVEKGDRIGVWFPENKQVIGVNYHHDYVEWRYPTQQIRRSYNAYNSTTSISVNTTYDFYESSSSTKEAKVLHGFFSLRANIGPRN
ncbi:hypothetical protein LOTGIDRAFT_232838 [Lottia gigantea]|uniref:Metalloendopeptidase n=1 Tax=Lottia gigantea TaxID=225164 RepID=V4ADB3_LOTGI|nr:hypothetical protein LOTGIDRAFT_232838 [Lottia gigantea]ESO93105.1 hypothetical protein LOTGIDRAFT_232838 [Lottia gigantea]